MEGLQAVAMGFVAFVAENLTERLRLLFMGVESPDRLNLVVLDPRISTCGF